MDLGKFILKSVNCAYKHGSLPVTQNQGIITVLEKVISNDPKGFIAGRYIGENVRTIYDILFETKQQ